jgi:hypothetical protein
MSIERFCNAGRVEQSACDQEQANGTFLCLHGGDRQTNGENILRARAAPPRPSGWSRSGAVPPPWRWHSLTPIPARCIRLTPPPPVLRLAMVDTIISYPLVRQPRRYGEFIAWVDATMKAHSATADARKQARIGGGPFKVFREEVLPFVPVAKHLYANSDAVIAFPADRGARDVIVTDAAQPTEQHFEIVTAVDGHDNRLRMELLSHEGHTPAFGPIEKVGPSKRSGYKIVAETTAIEHQQLVGRACQLIAGAIDLKNQKRYAADVSLVVHFDGICVRDSDVSHIVACTMDAAKATKFARVFLASTIAQCDFCQQIR